MSLHYWHVVSTSISTRSAPVSRPLPRNRSSRRASTASAAWPSIGLRLRHHRARRAVPKLAVLPEPWLCELTLQETGMACVPEMPRPEHSLSSPQETAPAADPTVPNRHEPEGCPAPFTSGDALPPVPLVARSGGVLRARASDQGFLPIDTQKYVRLLDLTGREIRENECGAILDHLAAILDRLGLDRSNGVRRRRR